MQVRTITEILDDGGAVIERREQLLPLPGGSGKALPSPSPPASNTTPRLGIGGSPAWCNLIRRMLDDGELWEGFDGLTVEQILEAEGLRRETAACDLLGVTNPLGVVLQFGPRRVREVRKWVETKKRTQAGGVSNAGALVVSVLRSGPPKGARRADNPGARAASRRVG